MKENAGRERISGLRILTIFTMVALLTSTLYLLYINGNLRQQLADSYSLQQAQQQSIPQTKLTNTETEEDRQRRLKEHLELLSLRGRVGQLTRELRERTKTSTPDRTAVVEPAESETTDSILFTASTTNRVPPGYALIIGGWHNHQMRGYFAISPRINPAADAPEAERLALNATMLEAPESFWAQIGWADAKSDARHSTISGVLTFEQLDALMQALKSTKGAEVSNDSLVKGREGERIGFGFSREDDAESGALMSLDAFPRIARDQQSVDLEIRSSKPSPDTPIHPLLRRP